MATTWQTIYDRAKRRYGYTTGEEDGLLTDALFLDRVNELLTQMADQAGGFREEFTLNLQLGEERFLVPGICLALAETELSRGRRDAPVALWADRWERALTQYADVVEESLRGNRRHVRFVPDNFDYG